MMPYKVVGDPIHDANGEMRCTGKTFRVVMTALERASSGCNVSLVALNDARKKDLSRTIMRIVSVYGLSYDKCKYQSTSLISFPSGGVITIHSGKDRNLSDLLYRGRRNALTHVILTE